MDGEPGGLHVLGVTKKWDMIEHRETNTPKTKQNKTSQHNKRENTTKNNDSRASPSFMLVTCL